MVRFGMPRSGSGCPKRLPEALFVVYENARCNESERLHLSLYVSSYGGRQVQSPGCCLPQMTDANRPASGPF